MGLSKHDSDDGNESEWSGISDNDNDNDHSDASAEIPPFSNPLLGHKLLTHAYGSLVALEADLFDYCA